MSKSRLRRMTLYERRRMSKSQYIKYDKNTQTWIQHRKVVYLYWYKFLQHAETDERFTVNWSLYESWGGRDVVMNTKFDEWWKTYWRENFGFRKDQGDRARFHTDKNPEITAMRTCLQIYENKHRGDNWDIGCWFARQEKLIKGRTLPKALEGGVVGFYQTREDPSEERESFDIWTIDEEISKRIGEGQARTGFGRSGREIKNPRIRKARKEADAMGIDGKESWVTLRSDDDRTRREYYEWETVASEVRDLRKIKKRVQGYVSRYLKQADDLMWNISQGSLDPPAKNP